MPILKKWINIPLIWQRAPKGHVTSPQQSQKFRKATRFVPTEWQQFIVESFDPDNGTGNVLPFGTKATGSLSVVARCGVDSQLAFPVDTASVQLMVKGERQCSSQSSVTALNVITCVALAPSGSRRMAVELIGLVLSRTDTAMTNIYSRASFSSLCGAGRRVHPASRARGLGDRMKGSMSAFGPKRTCASALQMSAFGPKRTCASALQMSAFGGKADMAFCGANVRF